MGPEGVLERPSDQLSVAAEGIGAWLTNSVQSCTSIEAQPYEMELCEVVTVGAGNTEGVVVSWKEETFDWLAVHAQEHEASRSPHGNEAASPIGSQTLTHCSQCKYTPSEMSLAQACASCQTRRLQNLTTE
jgi:hypothetical protein